LIAQYGIYLQFEGQEIMMDHRVGIFITMNPGYAGRTELPESVKALFRPVVVIVPDMQQICEIMLFSEGFLLAKVCLLIDWLIDSHDMWELILRVKILILTYLVIIRFLLVLVLLLVSRLVLCLLSLVMHLCSLPVPAFRHTCDH